MNSLCNDSLNDCRFLENWNLGFRDTSILQRLYAFLVVDYAYKKGEHALNKMLRFRF